MASNNNIKTFTFSGYWISLPLPEYCILNWIWELKSDNIYFHTSVLYHTVPQVLLWAQYYIPGTIKSWLFRFSATLLPVTLTWWVFSYLSQGNFFYNISIDLSEGQGRQIIKTKLEGGYTGGACWTIQDSGIGLARFRTQLTEIWCLCILSVFNWGKLT